MQEKLKLIKTHRNHYGLNQCLRALGVSKASWHYHQHRLDQATRDASLKAAIVEIIKAHSDYGYRRILEDLALTFPERVNHKRLRRVLNSYDLGLRRCLPATKPSALQRVLKRAGPSADLVKGKTWSAFEVYSTDFTEIIYAQGSRKAYLMVLLDIETRWVGGWAVGARRNRRLALHALDQLCRALQALGQSLEGHIVHHDKDGVYTSYAWLEEVLITQEARASYAENGARDNPWIESFWGRFKTENASALLVLDSLDAVVALIDEKMNYYNRRRRHSSLAYRYPEHVVLSIVNPEKRPPES